MLKKPSCLQSFIWERTCFLYEMKSIDCTRIPGKSIKGSGRQYSMSFFCGQEIPLEDEKPNHDIDPVESAARASVTRAVIT